MNTLARLDLLPAASLTSVAHTVKESLRGALYGPKLKAKELGMGKSGWSANPEVIRQDVFMACCEAAAMHYHPWLNHVAVRLPGTAPVVLS